MDRCLSLLCVTPTGFLHEAWLELSLIEFITPQYILSVCLQAGLKEIADPVIMGFGRGELAKF